MTCSALGTTPSTTAAALTGRVRGAIALLDRFPRAIYDLMFRIGIGMVFWKSGMTKLASWDITVALFRDEYQLPLVPPELAATLGTAVELTAPVLLAVGLLTRPAALALLGMTLTIQIFVYPENWAEHLLWASVLTYLVTRGAGPLSIDHGIARAVDRL